MILVTGGTGLVGAHLLMLLAEKDAKVRAIYRRRESIEKARILFEKQGKVNSFQKIEWIPADITDIPSLELAFVGVTKVYHCAAMISFDPSDEDALRKNNVGSPGTELEFAL